MYERFKNKRISVAFKFPIQGPGGGLGFPSTVGRLIESDSEGLTLDIDGTERGIPHSSIQYVESVSEIERAAGGLVIPNVRG